MTLSTDCLRLSQLQWCHSAPVRYRDLLKRFNAEFSRRNFDRIFFAKRFSSEVYFGSQERIISLREFQKYEKQIFRFFRNPDFSTDHPGTKIYRRFWAQPLIFGTSIAWKYGSTPKLGSANISPKKFNKKSNLASTARGAYPESLFRFK